MPRPIASLKRWGVLCVLVWLVASGSVAPAAEKAPAKTDRFMRIGRMAIDKARKEIRLTVQLALEEGILEFLLVTGHGRTYESVLKVDDTQPADLNFALLLIGSTPLPFGQFEKILNRGDAADHLRREHPDSLLELTLYDAKQRLSWWDILRAREATAPTLQWVHTGGYMLSDNRYAPDVEESFIAVWPTAGTVVNLFASLGNPYRGDFGLEMNTATEGLEKDHVYTLVIRRATP